MVPGGGVGPGGVGPTVGGVKVTLGGAGTADIGAAGLEAAKLACTEAWLTDEGPAVEMGSTGAPGTGAALCPRVFFRLVLVATARGGAEAGGGIETARVETDPSVTGGAEEPSPSGTAEAAET